MGKIFLIIIAIILFITFFITFIKGVFRRFFIRIINTSQQKQTTSDTVLFKNDKITVLEEKRIPGNRTNAFDSNQRYSINNGY